MADRERRLKAISIGVSNHAGMVELAFAPELVNQVSTALRKIDYEVVEVLADTMGSAEVGARILDVMKACAVDDLLIVHVLSHGELAEGDGTVYVLGSDGVKDPALDVDQWLKYVQLRGLRTLFLLDLCYSGTAARLPWQYRIDADQTRGWVIAACQPDRAAYDGRFSQALVAVLNGLRANEFDVDATMRYVPLTTVARALRQEVQRLSAEADSYSQTVTASLQDISTDPQLHFFANVGYTNNKHTWMRAGLNPGLRPFLDELDEGLDARHFLDRAAGVGRLTDRMVGCFSGRKKQLVDLSAWMDQPRAGGICVVTGSPGAGKSALLGIMVCAAHPVLRRPTKTIWDDVERTPYQVDHLAAVHARQRGVPAIVRSVANQLGLDEGRGMKDLLRQLRSSKKPPPVIVVDAVDEAENPMAVLHEFLLPLAKSQRGDGGPVARLLAGFRPYRQLRPLLDLAQKQDQLYDLDEVTEDILEEDLYKYVTTLLRTVPSYRQSGGGAVGAFAAEVARILSCLHGGGPFLVAGLYTRHLVSSFPDARALPANEALRLGSAVPHTLPNVLEIDLAARADQPFVRPVLTALARAREQGMPVTVLARIAACFCAGNEISLVEVRQALTEAKFYIRQSSDVDGTTVYRLFHQALVDHLWQSADLLDAMLDPLGPADDRDWAAAEPYVLRHVLAEAGSRSHEIFSDPGFLLLPGTVERLSGSDAAPESLIDFIRMLDPFATRYSLALAAARVGAQDLAQRAARFLPWQPLWSRGDDFDWDPMRTLQPQRVSAIRSLAVTDDGLTLAWSCEDHTVATWRVTEETQTEIPVDLDGAGIVAMSGNGRCFAVASDFDGSVQIVPHTIESNWTGHVAVLAVEPSGAKIVVVHRDGSGWLKTGDGPWQSFDTGLTADCWAVAWGDDPSVFASVGQAIYQWDLSTMTSRVIQIMDLAAVELRVSAEGHLLACRDITGRVVVTQNNVLTWKSTVDKWISPTALAVSADGKWLAVGDDEGMVSLYCVESATPVDTRRSHEAPVSCIAISSDGTTVASGDEDGELSTWWTRSYRPPGFEAPLVTACHDVAETSRGVLPVPKHHLLIGDSDGSVNLIDPESGRDGPPQVYRHSTVTVIGTQNVGGKAFGRVFWDDGDAIAWDPLTGRVLQTSSWDGFANKAQILAGQRTLYIGDRVFEIRAESEGVVLLQNLVMPSERIRLPGAHKGIAAVVRAGTLHGRPAVYTGATDGSVRIWLVDDIGSPYVITVPGAVHCMDLTDDGYLLVGAERELIAFHYNEDGSA
ncbi:hypothetical protein [Nocardia sp. CA-135398]|uniref:hypothetical protein n=1 Tax=Nocardia sp. CA-135398 TaxID=3239977 RepID=UPI003D95B2E4